MRVSTRPQLHLVDSGDRARPAPPPSRERLRELARQLAAGSYRVTPERIAAAMLAAQRS